MIDEVIPEPDAPRVETTRLPPPEPAPAGNHQAAPMFSDTAELQPAGLRLMRKLASIRDLLPTPKKSGWNPMFKSHYATLDGVYDAIEPILAKAGLHLQQRVIENPAEHPLDRIALETLVVDLESGEHLSSTITLPFEKKGPQAAGSALTYARRYGIQAVLGLRVDDDDGNRAQAADKAAQGQGAGAKVQSRISPDVAPPGQAQAATLPPDWEYVLWVGQIREAASLQELQQLGKLGQLASPQMTAEQKGEAHEAYRARLETLQHQG